MRSFDRAEAISYPVSELKTRRLDNIDLAHAFYISTNCDYLYGYRQLQPHSLLLITRRG